MIAQLSHLTQLAAPPAQGTAPTSAWSSLIAASGVVVGLLVGLGTPWLNSMFTRGAGRVREQHSVADQILQLWQRPEGIRELLVDDLYGTRRSLLLLGSRLRDADARRACLVLVHASAQGDPSESDIVDGWSDVVSLVSKVYRKTGS